jgi:hypothetical protein
MGRQRDHGLCTNKAGTCRSPQDSVLVHSLQGVSFSDKHERPDRDLLIFKAIAV